MYAFNESLTGPIDQPSPRISSVTPWRMSDWERPSWMSEALAQHIMLMKPGATASPPASMVCRARPSTDPMSVMVSPLMARSPTKGAPPLPS
jgi:hypothetical protein